MATGPSTTETTLDPGYAWNVKTRADLCQRARDLIMRARQSVYLAALPADLSALALALRGALGRGVRVVVFTAMRFELPGARVVVSPPPREDGCQQAVPGIALVIDGTEALVGEQVGPEGMRGCWTQSPLLVSMIELYLLRGGRRRFLVTERSQWQDTPGKQSDCGPAAQPPGEELCCASRTTLSIQRILAKEEG